MIKTKEKVFLSILISIALTMFVSSCKDEDGKSFPLSADIFYSVADKQVAFQALTHGATSWQWDFGDGATSVEQNPVHVYENGGYYIAVLTVSDGSGKEIVKEVKLPIALTPYILLTGGANAVNGKTWKLTADHGSGGDYFANADADLTAIDGVPKPLPTGVFDLVLGMGEVYKDTYTFKFDGSYSYDVKDDGASFGGIVYQFAVDGGASLVNTNGQDFGLCTALNTPEDGLTFSYVQDEDFDVPSVYDPSDGMVTYSGVATLDFSGTGFVGFLDFQSKVIVQEITDKSMQLVMFMAASPDYAPLNTHALILSFEVVE